MFICNDCGAVFDECKSVGEQHPYGMGFATEYWSVCPYCGENDIDEAKQCKRCGEHFAELEDGLCDLCWDEMYGE